MADDLNSLAVDMTQAAARHAVAARAIVQRGALNIKREAQQFAAGIAHAPHYPRSITYDTDVTPTGIGAKVGPDKNRTQGALGNILEYGTSKNAPLAHMGPALDREGPRFVKAVEDLAGDLL